ncbi:response regulator [Actinoplanes sp. NPDC051346]|uniref:response regulator n=1 Tax=Actinoplanes sp. NPDC051346 TaxID=3155048 RepID=UPI00343EF5E7
MVADDDADVADLIAYAFERAGHTVRTVLDGAWALQLIQDLEPDLVVLDHCMPGLTGADVVSALRAHPTTAATPILMITARQPDEMTVHVDRLLSKPVMPRQLTAVAAEMLRLQDVPSSGTQNP